MKNWLTRVTVAAILAGFTFSVAGCHTVKGAGKDVQAAGKKVERSSGK